MSAIMDGNALREGDTVQFVQVFDEKRGKMRAEDITGGITTDGYNAPRARFDDQVCFDFMKGRRVAASLFVMLSWPNGQGVALLRRRLRVRVPPGAPSKL